MRRGFAATAAALTLAAVTAAGCGGSSDKAQRARDPRPDPVVHSAAATQAAGSAKVAIRGSLGAAGQKVPITGRGAVDFRRSLAQLTVGTRLPGAGAITVDQLVDGHALYVRTPEFFSFLPGGRSWMKIDLAKAGVDLGALRALSAGGNPSQYLTWLAVAGNARRVGNETVGGVPTTRYAARIDARRLAGVADPAVRRSIEQLGVRTIPLDVWLDARGLVRRMHVRVGSDTTPVPASADLTIDFSDFGTTVHATRPAPGDTLDVTGSAANALRLLGG